MKKILFGVLVAVLAGCSNQKEVIQQVAGKPALSFNKDTVCVRERDWNNVRSTGNGKLTMYLSDPGHTLNLTIEDTSAKLHIMYRGIEIKTGESVPVMDSVLLFCVADAPGLYAVDCWLTDRLGRGDTKKLFVKCLASAAPTATFFYRDLGSAQLQSWNYLFDASNTVKSDGLIAEYHYSVNGQHIVTNQPVMNWTFHSKGDHKIGLYVTDDLGRKSETVYQTLTIL